MGEYTAERQHRTDQPLIVDVDDTLLRTDLLYETFWAAFGTDAATTVWLVARHWADPARLKHELLKVARPEVELLPVREQILARARTAQAAGRPVHLASGSAGNLIDEVARHLDIPGPHFASDPGRNLTRLEKAAELSENFGSGGYDYAGNSWADLPTWEHARRIIAVSPNRGLATRLKKTNKPLEIIDDAWNLRDLIKELRPIQWLKNALLFLPLLVTLHFQVDTLLAVLTAALSFSLGASAIYVFNDLVDLTADRKHPEKRQRPVASGKLPIRVAMVTSAVLALTSLGLAFSVGPAVFAMIAAYMALNLVYSLALKKRRWVDVVALAFFFLIRVLTGAFAAQIHFPPWVSGTVLAFFLALACVKRLTSLSRLHVHVDHHLPGRGYGPDDLVRLERLAYASTLVCVCLFLLGAFSETSAQQFSAPLALALAAIPVGTWLIRVIRLSVTGREDYDPVVFVTHDLPGLTLLGLAATFFFLAI